MSNTATILSLYHVTNNAKQIAPACPCINHNTCVSFSQLKLSITASSCGSRMYFGMHIHYCMISHINIHFTITNNLKQIVPHTMHIITICMSCF